MEEIYGRAGMVIKVKEPQPEEYHLLRDGQILFTYLHLAAEPELTRILLERSVDGVAYETIIEGGGLPCLAPMSEIAGRLGVQEGAKYLERFFGGRGVLLGGATGVERGRVTILGAGTVGFNSARIAVGMNAEVTVLDINADRLRHMDDVFGGRVSTLYSNTANIEDALRQADLVIGAVLLPGAKAPKLVKREYLSMMKKGAVLVDIAVDQGGCMETTRPTTHDDPIFIEEDVVCYCVANMPGSVPVTSTKALTGATLPYGIRLADKGVATACAESSALRMGLNTFRGNCTFAGVAAAHRLKYVDPATMLNN